MRLTKNRRRALIMVALAAPLLYFAAPFSILSEASRSDIQEACIRWLLRHNHSAVRGDLKVCYLGLGTTFDHGDGDFSPRDPPAEFLSRFADLRIPVHPVSEAKSNQGRISDASGKPGLCLSAGIVRRWSLGLVCCRGMYFESGLSAAGYEIYVLRVPFVWIPIRAKMLWLS